MPIEIIDTLAPKNNGVFPVADVEDISGAPQIFADTTARDAFPAGKLAVGMTCYVVDVATEYRLTAIDPLTWDEVAVGGGGGGAWGGITGTLSDQTDLYSIIGRDDGVTVLGSDTIVASFATTSKRRQTRAAAATVTIDGTGYAAGVDVSMEITNGTGSALAVSVIGAWSLIGDAVTEIPAGDTLIVALISRGTVEADVTYAMGVGVSP